MTQPGDRPRPPHVPRSVRAERPTRAGVPESRLIGPVLALNLPPVVVGLSAEGGFAGEELAEDEGVHLDGALVGEDGLEVVGVADDRVFE